MKKINIYLLLMVSVFSIANVKAANVETEDSTDANTKENKCPAQIIVKDDIDFSIFDSIFNYEEISDNLYYDFSEIEKYFTNVSTEEMDNFISDLIDNVGNPEINTNKYCPVYCAEEDTFVFPGYSPVINSGGHFTWTIGKNNDANILTGLTTRLQGVKYCATVVDIEGWIEDYKKILEEIDEYIEEKPPEIKANYSGGSGSGACGNYIGGYRKPENGALSPNPKCGKVSTDDLNTIQDMGVSVDNNTVYTGGASGVINYIDGAHADGRYYYFFSTNTRLNNIGVNQYEQTLHNIDNYSGDEDSYSLETYLQYASDTIANGTMDSGMDLSGLDKDLCIYEFEKACCDWKLIDTYTDPKVYLNKDPGLNQFAGPVDNIVNKYEYDGCSTQNFNFRKKAACTNGGIYNTITGKCSKGKKYTYEVYDTRYYNCKTSYYEAFCTFSSGLPDEQGEAARETVTNSDWSKSQGTPTCPSGYRLGSNSKCYWSNTETIERKIVKLKNLIDQLKSCSTLLESFEYYLETDMSLEYNKTPQESILKYSFSQDLEKTDVNNDNQRDDIGQYGIVGESDQIPTQSKKSDTISLYSYNNTSKKTFNININSVPFYFCDIGHAVEFCKVKDVAALKEYWNDYYSKVFVATYEYVLDGDTYRWVKMPSGESVSSKPLGDYLKYNRFIDIGYANYPVHFATPAGDYEGLNIRIKNIGYKNYLYNEYQTAVKEYNSTLTDNEFVSTEQNNELLHDCYYHVTEGEPYCPTVGCDEDEFDLGSVRIIYRPISLENPFPARDGDGRDTGSNWCIINNEDKTSDCSNENENVDKYILNNRNVVGSEVYNKEPMYQITLNPALIKQIREYNKSTNYDDYNLYCSGKEGEEGTECRSHFVVGGMEETNLPSFRDAFVKEGETCGMSSDWDACDKLDGIER